MQQEDLKNQRGTDPLIQYLNSVGIPVTRESYLEIAYPDGIPEMTSEMEELLPEHLRFQD